MAQGEDMRKKVIALFLILALCASVAAQKKAVPLDVIGDTAVVIKSFPCRIVAAKGAHLYDWTFPDSVKASGEDNVLIVTAAPKGTYIVKVRSTTIDFDSKSIKKDFGETTLVIGDVPGPDPGPNPPPTPDPPSPAPIPDAGFRVLIVEDPKERVNLPASQAEIIFDKSVRDYLNNKCVQDADGKTKSWRIWPHKAEISKQAKYWQDAMKRKRDSLPWIIISDGKKGYEGPLPKDVDSTLELLKKYGG